MKFSELWRLSSTVYKEVSFQSIFSLRAGSSLPGSAKRDIKRLVANAKINTLISKLITTIFIGIFAGIIFLPLTMNITGHTMPRQTIILAGVSAFLAVVLFLIVFMGLQVSTSFVSSKIVDVLTPLPLSKQDVSRIVFLCFIRIFDIPLIAAPAIFLAVYILIGGPAIGAITSILGIITAEIFALTLTTILARFFYLKVTRAGGRSKWQTLLRFAFMLVWILPTFAAYFVVNFAPQIVQSFASLTQGFSSFSQILVLIYPFSFGFLASSSAFPGQTDYTLLGLSITASVAYAILAYYCVGWVTQTIRKLGISAMGSGPREMVMDTFIQPQTPWLGIIRKDLRVASRAPSYATLFFLPVIQTAVLAVSFSSFSALDLTTALGILTGMSMITLLLPPTLSSIEGLASAYMRHLPMRKITFISAKTLLSIFTYVLSLIVLSIVAFSMGKSSTLILAYGAVHGFSVAAAVMLELTIVTRKFWKEGFAVGNLYSRLTTYILIVIPGYVLAAIPIISAFLALLFAPSYVLPLFLAAALTEFTLMTLVIMHQK
ncbi:MAG TPA: hypothetical protein VEH86_00675 [Candidatus Acidoferrum sp.]|nr:hypothetical protein [Candidatus Acidoferrum sp.]